MRKALIAIIRIYQKAISPLWAPRCRFYPSCSSYAAEAIEKYGPLVGLYLSALRIIRCHPFNPGGYDPVK